MRLLTVRAAARRDIRQAIDFYFAEGGDSLVDAFLSSYAEALRHIQEFPDSGSLRYAYILEVPDLRFWRIPNFPYLIFYRAADRVTLIRVLHAAQNIPGWMA